MAEIDVRIAGRAYRLACRDGEEAALTAAAALLDERAAAATAAMGSMSEARILLFAGLMLADRLVERGPAAGVPDPLLAERMEAVAARLEALAGLFDAP